jgi:uncharacterized UPF0146 family protein
MDVEAGDVLAIFPGRKGIYVLRPPRGETVETILLVSEGIEAIILIREW